MQQFVSGSFRGRHSAQRVVISLQGKHPIQFVSVSHSVVISLPGRHPSGLC